MKNSITYPATFFFILFFIAGLCSLNAQSLSSEDFKTKWEKAEEYLFFKEYEKAIPVYIDLFKASPENYQLAYKIGLAKLKSDIPVNIQNSLSYFEFAGEGTHKFFRNRWRETRSPTNTFYYLAQAHALLGNELEATNAYEQFHEKASWRDARSVNLKSREKWNLAEVSLAYENYTNALSLFHELFLEDTRNHHIAYKIGTIYLLCDKNQDVDEAIKYLRLATERTSARHKNTFREKKAPINAFYYIGIAHRLNEDNQSAINAFIRYNEKMGRDDANSIYSHLIDRNIQSARDAVQFDLIDRMQVHDINIEGFDPRLISCPILCDDVNLLIFAYGNKNTFPPDINFYKNYYDEQFDPIYMAIRGKDGSFHSAVNISDDLQIKYPHIPVTATSNGHELYLIVDEGDRGQIYVSKFFDGRYHRAEPVEELNSRRWESHASITGDGSRIYFTSSRRGSHGDLDIWYADRDDYGNWKKPKNLGQAINSSLKEEMPYISRDGTKLYFSSEAHHNVGGFNVFVSKYDINNDSWSTPKNLGYPYSTPGNDMGYFIEKDDFLFCPVNDNKRRIGIENGQCISLSKRAEPILANISGFLKVDNPDVDIPRNSRLKVVSGITGEVLQDLKINEDGTFDTNKVQPGEYNLVAHAGGSDLTDKLVLVPIYNDGNISNVELIISQTSYISYLAVSDDKPVARKDQEDIIADRVDPATALEKDTEFIDFYEKYHDKSKYIIENILFDFDDVRVKEKFFENLLIIADYLKKYENAKIKLVGHTDHYGTENYNYHLSRRRANSVKQHLLELGVDKKQLETDGRGQKYHITKKTENDLIRRFNRRVEIEIINEGENPIIIKPLNIPESYRQ